MIQRLLRTLLTSVRNPWIIALMVVVGLIVIVWFGGPHVAFGGSIPMQSIVSRLMATALLLFSWGIFVALNSSRQRKKMLADPDKAEEVRRETISKDAFKDEKDYLRNLLKTAIKIVTTSNFYGPRSRSRYVLPWYLIIGTQNSGKTSLLLNSGLKFPLNEQADRHLYDLKATHQCEIYYANEAVFVDTPGAYTEGLPETPSNILWNLFLRRLFKARPARPLNGIIVTVSMRDIVDADAARREHLARTIRARLSEVLKRLHSVVPVYLVLTKCDAVPGFGQFFAHLSRAEREQLFGCPSAQTTMEPGSVRVELRELMHTLNAQIIPKIHQERDLGSRGDMFRFPQELAKLGSQMEDFIAEAFGPSRYHRPVMFRGFFFTSALSAHDVISMTAREGELAFQQGFNAVPGDYAKGFFTLKLFKDLVIPEALLAGADKEHRWSLRFKKYGTQLATACLFLFVVSFLGISFLNNYTNLDQVDKAYAAFAAEQEKTPVIGEATDVLPELKALQALMAVYDPQSDSAITLGLGLYQGKTINAAAHAAYHGVLNNRLMPILRHDAAQRMLNSQETISELKPALRAYLMLCQPQYLQMPFIQNWLERLWSEQYLGKGDEQWELSQNFTYLLAHGISPIQPDNMLVDTARRALLRIPLAELAYQQMQEEAMESGKPPFSFRSVIGQTVFEGDTYEIPALYTRTGYDEYLLTRSPDIIRGLTDESWIFGDNPIVLSALDVNRVQRDVRTLYFRDYVSHWNQAIENLTVRSPQTLSDAEKVAEQLTGGIPPVVMVLREVRENTSFIVKTVEAEQTLADDLAETMLTETDILQQQALEDAQRDAQAVRQYFAPLDALLAADGTPVASLQAAHDGMSRARDYFSRLHGENSDSRIITALLDMADERDDTLRRLEKAAEGLPSPVRNWYRTVPSAGLRRMLNVGAASINRAYQENVVSVYNRDLRQGYPFSLYAERDVNLDAFSAFFRAGGTLDNFYESHLRPFINRNGQVRTIMGYALPISSQSVMQLQRANRVQDAFFMSGRELGISFGIEPHALDDQLKQVTLQYDGKNIAYWHGPVQGAGFNWPAAEGTGLTASLETVDLNGYSSRTNAKGDWALFRLLTGSTIKSQDGNTCLLEIQQNGKWAQFLVQFRSKLNPFDPKVCSFTLPESLL